MLGGRDTEQEKHSCHRVIEFKGRRYLWVHEKSEESKPISLRCSLEASPDQGWGRAGSHRTCQADLGRHVLMLATIEQSLAETQDLNGPVSGSECWLNLLRFGLECSGCFSHRKDLWVTWVVGELRTVLVGRPGIGWPAGRAVEGEMGGGGVGG